MIPQLSKCEPTAEIYVDFLNALRNTEFSGEIRADFASRLVTATDNSIYQVLPQAVVLPRSAADVAALFKLGHEDRFRTVTFSPRGGGTGTNGQSLTDGIVVDCSKYMNRILELNEEAGYVRVEPGIVLDELNAAIRHTGMFFAPTLSPSNRATIGGMINTDACGKGSRIYGRTSDHVLALDYVLLDGTRFHSEPVDQPTLQAICDEETQSVAHIHRVVNDIVTQKAELIKDQFPKMRRFLTGYNLAHVYRDPERFNMCAILCGAEGSLAVLTEARLKLTPIPQYKQLVAVKYRGFNDALSDAMRLLDVEPSAIETVDETILELARHDEIWYRVADFVQDEPTGAVKTVNLVEFTGLDEAELEAKVDRLCNQIQENSHKDGFALGYYRTTDEAEMGALWTLRKKGVGLLGNMKGERKPSAFVEDTAVPPENLADYIRDFRALLDGYGLTFAMFGHVDVGCLHVRPALNMQDPKDEALVRKISDQVVALVRKYGGVMWAEHGKGFRSEYNEQFFGAELYQDLRRIKAAFDPHNRMNPGKIVTPYDGPGEVVRIEAPLRGQKDRQIPAGFQKPFEEAMSCNGNGACFNYDPHHVMCPSSKITRDRIHSPKGRASMLREWLRQLTEAAPNDENLERMDTAPGALSFPGRLKNTLVRDADYDFSNEVYDAMGGCLSCKACSSQCPIHVNIPEFKAQFLQMYYTRYLRSPRDYLIGMLEDSVKLQAVAPGLVNAVLAPAPIQALLKAAVGLVDPPALSTPTAARMLAKRNTPPLSELAGLSPADKQKSVVLVQDAFTTYFNAPLATALVDLLQHWGYKVFLQPFIPNGKPRHVKGFLRQFRQIAQKNAAALARVAAHGVPLVGLEPSIVMTYRDEYPKILGEAMPELEVHLIQEWLVNQLDRIPSKPKGSQDTYRLLGHCMEKTGAQASQVQWVTVFKHLGLTLETPPAGCCGMAGTFGHEAEHLEESKGIYKMSWAHHIPTGEAREQFLVTGYSCRTQVGRFSSFKPKHPVQALLEVVRS